MNDPLDTRLPIMYGGTSIALRDTYAAPNHIWVPVQYAGTHCRANALSNLPAHARIPVLHGGVVLSPADIDAANPNTMNMLSLEDGSGNWEWEDGNEVEWPGEGGRP